MKYTIEKHIVNSFLPYAYFIDNKNQRVYIALYIFYDKISIKENLDR